MYEHSSTITLPQYCNPSLLIRKTQYNAKGALPAQGNVLFFVLVQQIMIILN